VTLNVIDGQPSKQGVKEFLLNGWQYNRSEGLRKWFVSFMKRTYQRTMTKMDLCGVG
jgi:hypothetical protein